ncbi:MAG: hypothetical protein ACXW4B_00390 [Micavibrio sp.]
MNKRKNYTLEKILKAQEGKNIRMGNASMPLPVLFDQWVRTILPWQYKCNLVPFLFTATFKTNLPDGINGVRSATAALKSHYTRSILPVLIDRRRYHQRKGEFPLVFYIPEIGGKTGHLHFHAIALVVSDIASKLHDPFIQFQLESGFRKASPYADEFHVKPISLEDTKFVLGYTFKKLPLLPSYFKNGDVDTILFLGPDDIDLFLQENHIRRQKYDKDGNPIESIYKIFDVQENWNAS